MITNKKESVKLMFSQKKNHKNEETRSCCEKNHEDEKGSKVMQFVAATAGKFLQLC